MNNAEFNILVQHICKRPAMYVGKPDYSLASTFIVGASFGLNQSRDSITRRFSEYLANKHKGYSSNICWEYIIKNLYPDLDDVALLLKLADEFQDFTDSAKENCK